MTEKVGFRMEEKGKRGNGMNVYIQLYHSVYIRKFKFTVKVAVDSTHAVLRQTIFEAIYKTHTYLCIATTFLFIRDDQTFYVILVSKFKFTLDGKRQKIMLRAEQILFQYVNIIDTSEYIYRV